VEAGDLLAGRVDELQLVVSVDVAGALDPDQVLRAGGQELAAMGMSMGA
jgi:hypothetical protein